jgi:hypothetical protein
MLEYQHRTKKIPIRAVSCGASKMFSPLDGCFQFLGGDRSLTEFDKGPAAFVECVIQGEHPSTLPAGPTILQLSARPWRCLSMAPETKKRPPRLR